MQQRLIKCLTLALGLRAARAASSVVVAGKFDVPQDSVRHDANAFDAATLPPTEDLLGPFVGDNFQYPFIKTNLDGGDSTFRYARQARSVEEALELIKQERISVVLKFEELDVDAWPASVTALIPEHLRDEITKGLGVEGGTTVHAYISAASTKALPTHRDPGDILVVQVEGEKDWDVAGVDDARLTPGDALWLPANTFHAARATDDGLSTHLTIHRVTDAHLEARERAKWEKAEQRRILNHITGSDGSDDFEVIYSDDECQIYDRGCDCSCNLCNLCSDPGAFCTTSASQMAIRDPCCVHEETGDYDDAVCKPDPETPTDAWMWRTKDSPRDKDCNYIAERPDDRCNMEGVFLYGAYGTIDNSGHMIRHYGKEWLFENQPVYTAAEACPIACGGGGGECVDDKDWYYIAGYKGPKGCCHVSKKPDERCDRKSEDGVKAKDACPAACGECETCTDDWLWYGDWALEHCGWVSKNTGARCNQKSLDGVKAKDACRKTCGTCDDAGECTDPDVDPDEDEDEDEDDCADSDDWYYKGKASKDCDWVAKKAAKKTKFCKKSKLKDPEGVKAKKGCPAACGKC